MRKIKLRKLPKQHHLNKRQVWEFLFTPKPVKKAPVKGVPIPLKV